MRALIVVIFITLFLEALFSEWEYLLGTNVIASEISRKGAKFILIPKLNFNWSFFLTDFFSFVFHHLQIRISCMFQSWRSLSFQTLKKGSRKEELGMPCIRSYVTSICLIPAAWGADANTQSPGQRLPPQSLSSDPREPPWFLFLLPSQLDFPLSSCPVGIWHLQSCSGNPIRPISGTCTTTLALSNVEVRCPVPSPNPFMTWLEKSCMYCPQNRSDNVDPTEGAWSPQSRWGGGWAGGSTQWRRPWIWRQNSFWEPGSSLELDTNSCLCSLLTQGTWLRASE